MGRPIHFELGVQDPQRAADFYAKTFGWKTEKWEGEVEYWLITTGEEGTPGIDGAFEIRDKSEPPTVNVLDVADIDDSLHKIEANGGSIVSGKSPVPGVGWVAYAKDTEGNLFGMMQSDPSAAAS
jgi:predicted enzyme related to lactoylglutathione lyase